MTTSTGPRAPVDERTIELVKASKSRRAAAHAPYRDRSRLAFIVQSFNRIANIDRLVAGLRSQGDHELIVCEDGSVDGSAEKWWSLLERPNDFFIHSNDLHEIRVLDRAIDFARAEVVCVVQDDDDVPHDTAWLDTALERFARHPRLAILGGFMGYGSFDPDPAKAKQIWGGTEFRFVQHVNIGPYFIRRAAYRDLGGWDHTFSAPGEPGIGFDNELCLRAWMGGYQVAYSFVPFKGPPGHYAVNGGTALFSELRARNSERNSATIFHRYGPYAERIDQLVVAANAELAATSPVPARARPPHQT